MAIEQPCFAVGFMNAAADLSAKQFLCVKVSADKKVDLNGVSGGKILGILQNKPKLDAVTNVMVLGVSKLMAGAGGLAADAIWMSANDGTGVTCTAAKVAGGTVLIGAAQGELATVTVGIATGATIAA